MAPKPPPDDYPITGLCIVADPSKCPPGYEVMLLSHDKKDDCDMWKDSFFRSRVTRYLCYTRIYPLDSGRLNNVLADIAINNVGDLPPSGFSLIEKNVDTGEKASRKKQFCVKMLARSMCPDAISSIIFLSKQKRPPNGYCLVGEMNGLILCFKVGIVPQDAVEPDLEIQNHTASLSAAPVPPPRPTLPHQTAAPIVPPPVVPARASFTRQDSSLATSNPMYGVPFHLNCCFRDVRGLDNDHTPVIHYRSAVDIDSEYNYSFHREIQAQTLTPSSPF